MWFRQLTKMLKPYGNRQDVSWVRCFGHVLPGEGSMADPYLSAGLRTLLCSSSMNSGRWPERGRCGLLCINSFYPDPNPDGCIIIVYLCGRTALNNRPNNMKISSKRTCVRHLVTIHFVQVKIKCTHYFHVTFTPTVTL